MIDEMANAVGIPREQLAFARKQSRLEPDKILMLEASTEAVFTTILVRAGMPLLIQIEVSRLFRDEGIRCYKGYVEACRDQMAGWSMRSAQQRATVEK